MSQRYKTIAIIVAGGSGRRFGSEIPKQFLPLLDRPMLLHTLQVFQGTDTIDAICVVIPGDYRKTVEQWTKTRSLGKVQWIVEGGTERQDSVRMGFNAIPECDIVLVHDGARPLVSSELIERVITTAEKMGASVPGLPVQETLKRVAEGGHVLTTVDRSQFAVIQTPQGFRYPILAEAIREAATDGFYGTDEAMLIERMGFPVCVVDGSRDNIKVTTSQDFEMAKVLLQKRCEN
jgi:2-C-methyl-D-erythritol 4-phosphate cytidylyltransferase